MNYLGWLYRYGLLEFYSHENTTDEMLKDLSHEYDDSLFEKYFSLYWINELYDEFDWLKAKLLLHICKSNSPYLCINWGNNV